MEFFACNNVYAQALHIDWAVFQNCPINVKIFQYFFGHFENCPINVQNYPINVKCLRTPPVQAFHIDWVVFKKYWVVFKYTKSIKTTQSMWNACTGGVRKHFTLIRQFSKCQSGFSWFRVTRYLPNQCEMLAQGGCASISHWLGNFQGIIWKVPNQCVKFLPICVIENEKYPINV